jgi:hypothetical protein
MASASLDIERLVREVLAELARAQQAAPAAPVAPVASKAAVPVPEPLAATTPADAAADEGELIVAARLLTMAEVAGRLGGIRRLVVRPQAIVTPAVQDELLRRGVALVRASAARSATVGELRLVLVVAGKRFDAAPLVDAIAAEGVAVEQQRLDCLMAATDLLAAEVAKADTLGALVSSHAAAALCLANRHRSIRAAQGLDVPSAAAATADVGANVLLIDPGVGTLFQWKQMLGEFCRQGVRRCPEILQKRLG